MRLKAVQFLIISLGVLIVFSPGFAETIIITKDSRTYTLPVEPMRSIEAVPGDEARGSGSIDDRSSNKPIQPTKAENTPSLPPPSTLKAGTAAKHYGKSTRRLPPASTFKADTLATRGTGEFYKQWVESGATKDFYNRQASLRWKNRLGDWRDVEGAPQGDKPYAQSRIMDTDRTRMEEWDVSSLVREWFSGVHPNNGFLLHTLPEKSGIIKFYSRETEFVERRPQLVLKFRDGRNERLFAVADTFLNPTTTKALGRKTALEVSRGAPSLLRFDLTSFEGKDEPAQALLQLHTLNKQYGASTIGVFRVDPGNEPALPSQVLGLAAKYKKDQGIENDRDVVLFSDFDNFFWKSDWANAPKGRAIIKHDDEDISLNFVPLVDKALIVAIPKGGKTGLNMLYLFKEKIGEEPEEIYFRYYLRLADDWNPTKSAGKFPGIAGTYDRAGWGGRRSDGTNGWSARGSFGRIIVTPDNPLSGKTPIGTYAYYGDMPATYGSVWSWSRNGLGIIENNHWYSIEQYIKLNTPGEHDGIMRVWIDGYLAMEKTNILFRKTSDLKIDRIWMNVYHGGTAVSPQIQHLFIDNVVVARQYIGPMVD